MMPPSPDRHNWGLPGGFDMDDTEDVRVPLLTSDRPLSKQASKLPDNLSSALLQQEQEQHKESGSIFTKIPWSRDILGISIVYFVQGTLDMALLAVQYYLKDELNLSPAAAGVAMTAGQIPWELTPIMGLITDTVPIFGYHRKAYLGLVGLTGGGCWLALCQIRSFWLALLAIFVSNMCTAWTQVIADAVLVKLCQGRDQEIASFYQGLSWVTYTVGAMQSAYSTGVLLDGFGPHMVFKVAGLGLGLDCLAALLVTEQPEEEKAAGLASAPAQKFSPGEKLGKVWSTILMPHILYPALFIFLWQSCPSPTTAMFYFQTEVLHFSPNFLELVYFCGSLACLTGVVLYQVLLVRRSLRVTLAICSLAGVCFNATQLLLVSRLNVRLGIPDQLFVLGDYAMLSTLSEVMMTPILAVSARMCPDGIEATLYATLYSFINLSTALSTALGAAVTDYYKVTETDFTNMFQLVLACNLVMLLPMPLLAWVPTTLEQQQQQPGEDSKPAAASPKAITVIVAEEQQQQGGQLAVAGGADDTTAVAQQTRALERPVSELGAPDTAVAAGQQGTPDGAEGGVLSGLTSLATAAERGPALRPTSAASSSLGGAGWRPKSVGFEPPRVLVPPGHHLRTWLADSTPFANANMDDAFSAGAGGGAPSVSGTEGGTTPLPNTTGYDTQGDEAGSSTAPQRRTFTLSRHTSMRSLVPAGLAPVSGPLGLGPGGSAGDDGSAVAAVGGSAAPYGGGILGMLTSLGLATPSRLRSRSRAGSMVELLSALDDGLRGMTSDSAYIYDNLSTSRASASRPESVADSYAGAGLASHGSYRGEWQAVDIWAAAGPGPAGSPGGGQRPGEAPAGAGIGPAAMGAGPSSCTAAIGAAAGPPGGMAMSAAQVFSGPLPRVEEVETASETTTEASRSRHLSRATSLANLSRECSTVEEHEHEHEEQGDVEEHEHEEQGDVEDGGEGRQHLGSHPVGSDCTSWDSSAASSQGRSGVRSSGRGGGSAQEVQSSMSRAVVEQGGVEGRNVAQ